MSKTVLILTWVSLVCWGLVVPGNLIAFGVTWDLDKLIIAFLGSGVFIQMAGALIEHYSSEDSENKEEPAQ